MPSYRCLQQYAVIISIVSIIYNGAEGGISIGFGAENSSRSLVLFGIQSCIEVTSAAVVCWRFWKVAQPGEERAKVLDAAEMRIERFASTIIGWLLVALSLATEAVSIVSFALHQEPDSSNASLIISASALVFMIFLWLPKRYLAKALNSTAMQGEATCSLSCIQITIALFLGSLVYRLWHDGWWVDAATSMVLGLLFAWEAYKILVWVHDPAFDGGCCRTCAPKPEAPYEDLCGCCSEKEECQSAGHCLCNVEDVEAQLSCCTPTREDGTKCCTHSKSQAEPSIHLKTKCCEDNRDSEDEQPSQSSVTDPPCASNGLHEARISGCTCTSPPDRVTESPCSESKKCCSGR